MAMESPTIRQIIEQVETGQIRVPAFQRGFVWEPDRVAHFIDSLYKNYPFGALLFWRTNEQLEVEKELGPFKLPAPKEDYPIDYVLDGQQRVTSIYATFQTKIKVQQSEEWKDIYFDYTIENKAQEPQFFALDKDDVDPSKHFPLRCIFDTTEYRRATRDFDDELAKLIDEMQSSFKEARFPVQLFRTDDKGTVAVIFERINRQGVPLDTLQLLEAWTWSEDFQLHGQFEDLVEELESIGFSTGSFDENLLLRCASAILVSDPRPDAIVRMPGRRVRTRFDEVLSGVLGALDFLSSNVGIRKIENLPFQTILVPLSVFFAVSGEKEFVVNDHQRNKLLRWFWRSCFVKRFSSGVLRHLEDDIKAMMQLKGGQQSNLGDFTVSIDPLFFIINDFGLRTVNTKSFILLLAQNGPLSLISGNPIDLGAKLKDYNKAEFHHLMPKAYLKQLDHLAFSSNCLANMCFLSRSENKRLGGVRPSQYKDNMPGDPSQILNKSYIPESLFSDDYNWFIDERSKLLSDAANALIR